MGAGNYRAITIRKDNSINRGWMFYGQQLFAGGNVPQALGLIPAARRGNFPVF